MGELELSLSELAALRPGADVGDAGTGCCVVAPLTTMAVVDAGEDGGGLVELRKDGGVVDDAVGCVTPTLAVDASDGVGEFMESRKDGGVVDDAAGCVTPTARRDGGGEEDGAGIDISADGDVGFVTPTARRDGGGEEDGAGIGIGADSDVGFVTPVSAASALGQPTVCPPAPRKQVPAKRKISGRGTPRRFFFSVPRDLDAVFLPAAASSPPSTSPASKKSRVHVVG